MKQKVTQFIEKHIDIINDNRIDVVFEEASENLSTDEIAELADVLSEIGIETTQVRWDAFDKAFKDYCQYELNLPGYMKGDSSNSWARVDYILDGISTFGFSWKEAKKHILENSKKLNIELTPLEPEYGWEGEGDYALQWFDKGKFRQEYADEFDLNPYWKD